jgi:hypothetical protein
MEQEEHVSQFHEHEVQDEYGRKRYDLRTLLSWSAPGRPFQKRGKEYFLNILIIMLLVQVILFLFSQYALMALVLALVFLTYALNTVSPHDFHYKVTSQGIMVEDHFFLWQELYDFYFKQQNGVDVLIIGTKAWYPGELTIVLGMMHVEHVRDILLQYLPYREYVKPTFMEKSATWLEKNFPLDRKHDNPAR